MLRRCSLEHNGFPDVLQQAQSGIASQGTADCRRPRRRHSCSMTTSVLRQYKYSSRAHCAEDDCGKEPESDRVTVQRPASVRELAVQFEAGVALVENVKQPRLIVAVREARIRVENGIRAHLERRRLQVGKLLENFAGPSTCEVWAMSGAILRGTNECMLQVPREPQRSQGRSALYAGAC